MVKTVGFSGLNVFKTANQYDKCGEWKQLILNAPAAIICYDKYYSNVSNAFDILTFEVYSTNEAQFCGARLLLEYIKNNGSLREGLKQYGPLDVGYFYADAVIEIYEKSKFQ